jgi:hypothetical protein
MKSIRTLIVYGVIGTMLVVTGCGTIITKSEQTIPINSSPSEAAVEITDANGNVVQTGKTPFTVTLKKGAGYFKSAEYRVNVEKDGYAPVTFNLTGEMNVWYLAGNLGFGGFLGWLVVDPLTGGMWTLSPEQINANLAQQQSGVFSQDGITIVLKEQVPDELEPYLVQVTSGS